MLADCLCEARTHTHTVVPANLLLSLWDTRHGFSGEEEAVTVIEIQMEQCLTVLTV